MTASVRDKVSFGTATFFNDEAGTMEWVVVKQKSNGEMLLVRNGAFLQADAQDRLYRYAGGYYESWGILHFDVEEAFTWENCSLRSLLNSDNFIQKYFTPEEQAWIVETTVSNQELRRKNGDVIYRELESISDYDSLDWDSTQDKVFLLSFSEVEKIFFNSEVFSDLTEEVLGHRGLLRDFFRVVRNYALYLGAAYVSRSAPNHIIEIRPYNERLDQTAFYGVRINPYLE